MKCPICSHENYDGAKFCLHCGACLPQPPSRAKLFFVALLKAMCYYLLFFAIQSAVIFIYEISVIIGEMMGSVIDGGFNFNFGTLTEDMMLALLDQLAKNIHLVLILSSALTLLVLFLTFQMRRKNPFAEMGLRPAPAAKLPAALMLGIGLQFVVSITLAFLPIPAHVIETFNQNSELLVGGGPLWLELLSIVVITPLVEEIIFRGLVFTRLRRGTSLSIAVIVGSLIFGSAHGHIISFIYAGCLGILLSLIMLRCGDSVIAPFFCHAGFNGGSYLLTLILGEGENLPLLLMFYMLAMALSVLSGYMLFRAPRVEE